MQQSCRKGIACAGGIHSLDGECRGGDAAFFAVAAGAMLTLGHNQIFRTGFQQTLDGGFLGVAAGKHLGFGQIHQQVVGVFQHRA